MTVRQVRRAFTIGSCVNARDLRSCPAYGQFFLSHFNGAVLENELKWAAVEPRQGEENFQEADWCYDWLRSKGVPLLRGHCLLWDNEVPPWLDAIPLKQMAGEDKERCLCVLERVTLYGIMPLAWL